jgi:hypothetical protein
MTVHGNRFLVNKTNRCTEFQFYWYYDSTCFGQLLCPSSGILSLTSVLVHFMQLWWPSTTRSRMELQFHPTPGKRSSQMHKMYQNRCTAKNSWWWAERLPETCTTNKIGFIHKQWVMLIWQTYWMSVRRNSNWPRMIDRHTWTLAGWLNVYWLTSRHLLTRRHYWLRAWLTLLAPECTWKASPQQGYALSVQQEIWTCH